MSQSVVLFGRDGCCLCDEARAIIARASENRPLADSGESFSNHAHTVASSRWSSHNAASPRRRRNVCEGQLGLADRNAR